MWLESKARVTAMINKKYSCLPDLPMRTVNAENKPTIQKNTRPHGRFYVIMTVKLKNEIPLSLTFGKEQLGALRSRK